MYSSVLTSIAYRVRAMLHRQSILQDKLGIRLVSEFSTALFPNSFPSDYVCRVSHEYTLCVPKHNTLFDLLHCHIIAAVIEGRLKSLDY